MEKYLTHKVLVLDRVRGMKWDLVSSWF